MATYSTTANFSSSTKPPVQKPTSTRGFAAMDPEKHKKVSSQGGRASQQQQHSTRQQSQGETADKISTENFSAGQKQESSTESASSDRNVSNQSTGINLIQKNQSQKEEDKDI